MSADIEKRTDAGTVRVFGLAELNRALRTTIPEHYQKATLQKALLAGAKIIVQDAQNRVPVKTGLLKKAIYSYPDREGGQTFQSRLIGVRGGKSKTKKLDAYYWRFIEFGRAEVSTKGHRSLGTPEAGFFGRTVKAYPAHPFLRPAFEAKKLEALTVMQSVLAAELVNAANLAKWSGPQLNA
jgi:HK97 gp10 family phage protein